MRGNLIDRPIALGYGDPASSPLAHVVCEEVWARNSPRRLSIGLSGAGNHRCGWRQTDRALPEFLAVTIRNKNTRAAYMTAVGQFCAWCKDNGLPLAHIRPLHVSAYKEAGLKDADAALFQSLDKAHR